MQRIRIRLSFSRYQRSRSRHSTMALNAAEEEPSMATTTKTVYLTLDEARAMVDRAVEKARELRQAGAIVIVDAGGNVVSISRMDDSPVSSIQVSRAKAYVA